MNDSPRYQVKLEKTPAKLMRRLPQNLIQRLAAAIDGLSVNPRPHGCKRLKGHDLYRIRVGNWRIIYQIKDAQLLVLIVEVAPRGGAYRNL